MTNCANDLCNIGCTQAFEFLSSNQNPLNPEELLETCDIPCKLAENNAFKVYSSALLGSMFGVACGFVVVFMYTKLRKPRAVVEIVETNKV